MSVDERARHQLHERLAQLLGDDEASTLMGYLPPVGWADVATARDLEHHAVIGQSELALLREQFRADNVALADQLRAEMAQWRDELRGEMAQLRAETRDDIGAVRADLSRLSRSFFLGLIGAVATLTGVVVAAAVLG